jgi:DUF1680 family protein
MTHATYADGLARREPLLGDGKTGKTGKIGKIARQMWPPQKPPKIGGHVGGMIQSCISNGVMAADYSRYVNAFREKMDSEGSFCGEFWGKWAASAALAYEYDPSPRHLQVLKDAVGGILSVQEADGRISCSATDFTAWDLWGRKYVLLGLLAYYDATRDKDALNGAARMLDNLIGVTQGAGKKVTETGLAVLQGLSSCSILQPVVLMHERTGESRYLAYAKHLAQLWEQPSAYSEHGLRLISDSLAKKAPVRIAVPKGYEIMSCFEGLCELYRVTGEDECIRAVLSYMNMVLEREIMIVGSGSSGELWCDGAYRQTQVLETPMETCVTATFMKICRQLLCITGDSKWADWLEISLFNALAGAMEKDGSWWAYFSPLQGCRIPSPVQIEAMQSSCCVLNGPRALLEVPKWCVAEHKDGISVNLYQQGVYHAAWDNREIVLAQNTRYPVEGSVSIRLASAPCAEYAVDLRIPEWSGNTQIRVNGKDAGIDMRRGDYARIQRKWRAGDEIQLDLDIYPRIVKAPGNPVYSALMSGPVVLGMSPRFIDERPESLWLMDSAAEKAHDGQLGLSYYRVQGADDAPVAPVAEKCEVPGALTAYKIRFAKRPVHFFAHSETDLLFCDYASCAESLTDGTPLRVWFSQPQYMNGVFPKGSRATISGEGAFSSNP